MILQALNNYYRRLVAEGCIVAQGFQEKDIPFIIVLDREGRFVDLEDTWDGEGRNRRARRCVIPRAIERHGETKANLLWDNEGYVLGYSSSDPRKAREQNAAFHAAIRETFADSNDVGIQAVLSFLSAADYKAVFDHPTWKAIAEKGANISFRLKDETALVCERAAVCERIAAAVVADDGNAHLQTCLVSGLSEAPVRLHAPIKGVQGANTTGAKVVSFKLPAFRSYQKEQGLNAPVGSKTEFAYTTALNTLLDRDSRQKLTVGDATAVFWAERENKLEKDFADFFGVQEAGKVMVAAGQDLRKIVALYRSPRSGVRPELDPNTKFFILGLSPNAARVAVRFWYAATVGEVADNINQHFDDLDIIHSARQPPYLPLLRLIKAIAPLDDESKVPPNIAGDFMKAILAGTHYPRTLLTAAIGRIRAEQSRKDKKTGKQLENVTYPRAALVKAVLARESRLRANPQKEVGMGLDPSNTNIGYRLGRLFAVLERVQEKANPGINATIRDRFYGSSSSTPVVAFPLLMKLKNHHLSKLDMHKDFYERLLREIIDKIEGYPGFPTHLMLDDQGRFAIGYYHQRQDLFKKSDKPRTP